MKKSEFHPFPFHPFPKEIMLGTSGNFEYFHLGSPVPDLLGMGGNEWERVGMGDKSNQLGHNMHVIIFWPVITSFMRRLTYRAGRRRIAEDFAHRFVSLSKAKRIARHIP